jgi:hypothetical protein
MGPKDPTPYTAEKLGASDRALFPEIDRLMNEGRSLRAAAMELVLAGKVDGRGGARGRMERLTARYRKQRDRKQRGLPPEGARYEIAINGRPQSHHDTIEAAWVAATNLKTKQPHARVTVCDLQTGTVTAIPLDE